MTLRLGLPKGSLEATTLSLLKKAGFNVSVGSRSYFPVFDDPELEGLLIPGPGGPDLRPGRDPRRGS